MAKRKVSKGSKHSYPEAWAIELVIDTHHTHDRFLDDPHLHGVTEFGHPAVEKRGSRVVAGHGVAVQLFHVSEAKMYLSVQAVSWPGSFSFAGSRSEHAAALSGIYCISRSS